MRTWVIVPALDEASVLPGCLTALAAQSQRDFCVVVVDNDSVDGTAELARDTAAALGLDVHVVRELERGAGCAADTGFRFAIARGGELLLRTDADCLPAPDWVQVARRHVASGAEMVCGRSVPRRDEHPSLAERRLLPALVRVSALYGRYRRAHRDPRYLTPYVLCHGHNLALTADLYQRCGGALRVELAERSEDVALLNRARQHSRNIVRAEDLVVQNSLRRLRAWGPRRTLLWYWDRRYRPDVAAEAHVRATPPCR